MSEITNGLRHILVRPLVYDTFQHLVGAYAWRKRFTRQFVNPELKSGSKVIDIGCGTGEILKYLPKDVSYYGIDRNPAYIQSAQRRFKQYDANFVCDSVGYGFGDGLPKFNVALAVGLMHHLDDSEVRELLIGAQRVLRGDGTLFMLDPVLLPEQSTLSRLFVSKDRGQNVRTLDGYLALCSKVFSQVEYEVDKNPLRIPYAGVIITCS